MSYVSVVLDIPTRALASTYDYLVPSALEGEAQVGATVLVPFAGRPSVGYVVRRSSQLAEGLALSKVKPIQSVLAPSAFDASVASMALWMAEEYACPPVAALRLFLPPGREHRIRKTAKGEWELVAHDLGAPERRWVRLVARAKRYVPSARAVRQKTLIELLGRGPMRLLELRALLPGYKAPLEALRKRGVVELFDGDMPFPKPRTTTLKTASSPAPEQLSDGQSAALFAIAQAVGRADGSVVLVDGVTGSGKTEVYLEAIEAVLALGRSAVVLVPEISLTPQTVGRFRSRFPDRVAVLHSRLSVAERRQQWELVASGAASVVVGARSALFCPVKDLGLIVIDEEHEFTYKQEQAPRYHAREVAAELARQKGATVVLGSATPSLESLERCRKGRWRGASWERVLMPERPSGALLPEVSLVDLRGAHQPDGTVFSQELAEALRETYARGEKSLILINRRGFATFLMCLDCGCVPQCPHCSSSLAYHATERELMCHSCGRIWPVDLWSSPAGRCPHCKSRYLQALGVGSERVESELSRLLPDAPIIRMDADTTRGAQGHQTLLERFDALPGAVLVGTQMIAKGLDFPEVTLVGVINADISLKLPDFRASERTYDLLEQVAGRAGRGERPGRVIVQSRWTTHPAISSVRSHDREAFFAFELAERSEAGYPPFTRLANVLCSGKNLKEVRQTIEELARRVRETAERERWQVLGPSACVRSRVKDRYRHHLLVKAPLNARLGPALLACSQGLGSADVTLAIDVDPYDVL